LIDVFRKEIKKYIRCSYKTPLIYRTSDYNNKKLIQTTESLIDDNCQNANFKDDIEYTYFKRC